MDKIRLDLVGITYNQIESGVYAVILQQAGGTRRIPIIIGFAEAQAIECRLQEVVTPRPLTQDLMDNIMSSFGVALQEVNIHRLPNGVFAGELVLFDGEHKRLVDARSSDAIALAIRVGAPIYTSYEVLEEAGFEPGEPDKRGRKFEKKNVKPSATLEAAKGDDLSSKSIEQLQAEMQRAAEAEDYELAAKIKAELDKRM